MKYKLNKKPSNDIHPIMVLVFLMFGALIGFWIFITLIKYLI